MFVLPFHSLEDVLQAAPMSFQSRSAAEKAEKRERKREKREKRGMHTPMDPMPRIAS